MHYKYKMLEGCEIKDTHSWWAYIMHTATMQENVAFLSELLPQDFAIRIPNFCSFSLKIYVYTKTALISALFASASLSLCLSPLSFVLRLERNSLHVVKQCCIIELYLQTLHKIYFLFPFSLSVLGKWIFFKRHSSF